MTAEYVLLVVDVSGEHRPVVRLVSSTPFHTVTPGERFDDVGWTRLDGQRAASPEEPKRYVVHSVKHQVYPRDDQLVVEYWINVHPYHGPRSSAWGDE